MIEPNRGGLNGFRNVGLASEQNMFSRELLMVHVYVHVFDWFDRHSAYPFETCAFSHPKISQNHRASCQLRNGLPEVGQLVKAPEL